MRPRCLPCFLLLMLAAPAGAALEAPAWRATGTIEARQASADGRYRVHGQALLAPAAPSADGRFVLKAVSVSCDPSDDRLFGDGFEAP